MRRILPDWLCGTSSVTQGLTSTAKEREREYNDFMAYVMSQVPTKKRPAVASKYDMLKNGQGKKRLFYFITLLFKTMLNIRLT